MRNPWSQVTSNFFWFNKLKILTKMMTNGGAKIFAINPYHPTVCSNSQCATQNTGRTRFRRLSKSTLSSAVRPTWKSVVEFDLQGPQFRCRENNIRADQGRRSLRFLQNSQQSRYVKPRVRSQKRTWKKPLPRSPKPKRTLASC